MDWRLLIQNSITDTFMYRSSLALIFQPLHKKVYNYTKKRYDNVSLLFFSLFQTFIFLFYPQTRVFFRVEISTIISFFSVSHHIIFFFYDLCPSGIEIALNKDARQKSRLKSQINFSIKFFKEDFKKWQ